MKRKIGVFDSGKGGRSVLEAIKERLPNDEYLYIGDSKNCPYGEKTDEELERITTEVVQRLAEWGAEIVVIACNTASLHRDTVKNLSKIPVIDVILPLQMFPISSPITPTCFLLSFPKYF